MQLTAFRKFWICVVLVGVPGLAHAVNLTRFVSPSGDVVIRWGMAISATIPYVFLMLVFLAHCDRYERKAARMGLSAFPRSACWGASAAWIAMMLHSRHLINAASTPQRLSSTMGIAVMPTPLFYLPYLALPYLAGGIAGGLWPSRSTRQTENRE
jgi:hypothetical protein